MTPIQWMGILLVVLKVLKEITYEKLITDVPKRIQRLSVGRWG